MLSENPGRKAKIDFIKQLVSGNINIYKLLIKSNGLIVKAGSLYMLGGRYVTLTEQEFKNIVSGLNENEYQVITWNSGTDYIKKYVKPLCSE